MCAADIPNPANAMGAPAIPKPLIAAMPGSFKLLMPACMLRTSVADCGRDALFVTSVPLNDAPIHCPFGMLNREAFSIAASAATPAGSKAARALATFASRPARPKMSNVCFTSIFGISSGLTFGIILPKGPVSPTMPLIIPARPGAIAFHALPIPLAKASANQSTKFAAPSFIVSHIKVIVFIGSLIAMMIHFAASFSLSASAIPIPARSILSITAVSPSIIGARRAATPTKKPRSLMPTRPSRSLIRSNCSALSPSNLACSPMLSRAVCIADSSAKKESMFMPDLPNSSTAAAARAAGFSIFAIAAPTRSNCSPGSRSSKSLTCRPICSNTFALPPFATLTSATCIFFNAGTSAPNSTPLSFSACVSTTSFSAEMPVRDAMSDSSPPKS